MNERDKIKEELPMNWWNFWKYFRFPVSIFFSIFNFIGSLSVLKDVQLNIYGILLLVINIALIIFLCITFYFFITRKKYGFEMLIIYSIAEVVFNSFINTFSGDDVYFNNITELVISVLIISGIVCAIWVYPNYIYFKKRRHLFGEEEQRKNNEEQNLSESFNTIPNNEEKNEEEEKKETINEEIKENLNNENKKYCTKCGNQIEQNWMFCNYCGNKLK